MPGVRGGTSQDQRIVNLWSVVQSEGQRKTKSLAIKETQFANTQKIFLS